MENCCVYIMRGHILHITYMPTRNMQIIVALDISARYGARECLCANLKHPPTLVLRDLLYSRVFSTISGVINISSNAAPTNCQRANRRKPNSNLLLRLIPKSTPQQASAAENVCCLWFLAIYQNK